MPQIFIDGRCIQVDPGTKVIQAAERLGIYIPRLCYHPALGSAGACRLCAVSFLEGPVKGVLMSCMVEAKDGMVISTRHPDAVEFRRQVMEWLMMNHPHDCPVCDEGGHCVLQEMTVAGGHSMRRYPGSKRTYRDQDLGPFIQHEMNRCIHCWRCRRFYQEYCGYKDLGVMGLASRTYFGKALEGPLESPFSGNLIDICPTGVFTDKPSKFRARRWECQRGPSVCIHCSLGCSTVVNVKYREVLRVEAGQNPEVNGYFICDRGRYGFDFTNHPQRPRRPLVEGRPCSWREALAHAAALLQEIIAKHGHLSVALASSARASLESLGALSLLSETHGLAKPYLWMERQRLQCARTILQGADLLLSMGELQEADPILVLGLDPIHEAPMLALALRQAWRRGAWIGVVDPRAVELPFSFHHLAPHYHLMDDLLACLCGKAPLDAMSPELEAFVQAWNEALDRGQRPAIACGTLVGGVVQWQRCMELARSLRVKKGWGGVFPVLPGANSLGAAAVLGGEAQGSEELLERIRGGRVRALVLVETDPFFTFCGKSELERAFQGLDLLLVLDFVPSQAAKMARVFLPSKTLFESSCLFVNNEGRLQEAKAVHQGGIPLSQLLDEQGNPPRLLGAEIPGAEPLAPWEALAGLSEALGKSAGFSDLQGMRRILGERFPWLQELDQGQRICPLEPEAESHGEGSFQDHPEQEVRGGLRLALVQATFGTEELSCYSRPARQMEGVPLGFLNANTAHSLGLGDRELVRLQWEAGELEFLLCLKEDMSPDFLAIQAHWLLGWEKAGRLPKAVRPDQIRRKP